MGMVSRDDEHLRILSICHYVYGGVQAAFACIPLIHVAIGLVMVFAGVGEGRDECAPLAIIGGLFAVIGAAVVLFGWAVAACVVYAGRCLAQRKSHTFCFVMAAICCLFIPFGTVLGVFTIIVLSRPSVKALFETGRPPAPVA
ncbi:MAG: hypothetical protein ABIF82_01365 [Planctomycetota bacterium]